MIKVEFSFSTIEELAEFLARSVPPKYDTSFDVDELERQLQAKSSTRLTLADLREAILDASNRGRSAAVRDLLARYGVKKASELPEDQWQSFHMELLGL